MKKILLVVLYALCLQLISVQCQSEPIPDTNLNPAYQQSSEGGRRNKITYECKKKIFDTVRIYISKMDCVFENCYNTTDCRACYRYFNMNQKNEVKLVGEWQDCVRNEEARFQREEEERLQKEKERLQKEKEIIKKEEERKNESKYLTLTPEQSFIAYGCFQKQIQEQNFLMLQKMCMFNNCFNSGLSDKDCLLKCFQKDQNNIQVSDIGSWMSCVSFFEEVKEEAFEYASNVCTGQTFGEECEKKQFSECENKQFQDCLLAQMFKTFIL